MQLATLMIFVMSDLAIPYKMKYWRGVNFGDWQFLNKIANI